MALSKIPSAGFQDNVKFRNIIINGDMSIAQRGTSASSISSGSTYNTCDRWVASISSLGTWTQSQSTDVPTGQGFSKSLKMDCTTADASPSAGDYCIIQQRFEGQNLQYLKKGTSNAEQVTLSFWVKSNKTGTYVAQLEDVDNNRSTSKSYTINSANTWEKKTITYDADTTGAFDNDNGFSLTIQFWLGAGSDWTSGTLATTWESQTSANRAVGQVNLADSTSNEWYITGVQLEAGETASDFEFLPHDVNLQRCKRYFEVYADGSISGLVPLTNGTYYTSTGVRGIINFDTEKRTSPTLNASSGTNFYSAEANGNNGDGFNSLTQAYTNPRSILIFSTSNISGTSGHGCVIYSNNNAKVSFEAEL